MKKHFLLLDTQVQQAPIDLYVVALNVIEQFPEKIDNSVTTLKNPLFLHLPLKTKSSSLTASVSFPGQ